MLDKRVTTFIQVVESGSIAKAARLLYLSKVSVKAQMDSLEAEMGVPPRASCCWTSCPTAWRCPAPIRWPSAISSAGTIWAARPS